MTLFCGQKSQNEHTYNERIALISECQNAAKIAQDNNVILCMECHNWSYTETIDGALELMEAVNSPNFLMYWQPNQFVSEEVNINYAKQIAPYCKHIHAFNWKNEERFSLTNGKEIWKKYLNELSGTNTILLEFMPDDKLESLNTEAQALFSITERNEN